MARFYGKVGFIVTEETSPGVWTETTYERFYYGNVLKSNRRYATGEGVNDNLDIRNEISIVADAYADKNSRMMRYIEWMGTLWEITDILVERPRLRLTIGGVYNGQQT